MTVQDNAAKITDLERTSYDNQRRVSAIEITVSECQTLALCEERNGRVMDAVDRLNETTAELQSTFRKFQEERAATDRAASRHTRATLISVILLGLSLIGAAIFKHMMG